MRFQYAGSPIRRSALTEANRVRAVLGPTNTGKTHLAVERMLAHGDGMIGLPLRLLAREVYDRMVAVKGERACALITGEERIAPPEARYFACTVEAMPVSREFEFVGVDEIQLASDPDRGHVFTSRILNARGNHETMLMGADTVRPVLNALDLDIDPERRERFSQLSYAGPLKITKLPKRSAVVAFSAEEVYAIAELLKRQRGGCAVIMGALSPRTRNAQVELYQAGEVDYIVATDAIGMGLNLDVGHIAFASRRKFDGRNRRMLRADELAQIAGRAGRFRDDGTFGETADCPAIEPDVVERICEHRFEPLETVNWRNDALDFSSLDALMDSLKRPSPHKVLRRAPEALDESTLAALSAIPEVRKGASSTAHVRRLWDLCTLPDFRKHGEDGHIRLVSSLAEKLMEPDARIKDEWMFAQVERLDSVEGDIDTLQGRLAQIRTWTYAANRADWLENAATWRERTRDIEDRLSDALHEGLMQRFVDRRTSALLKALHSEDEIAPVLEPDGRVLVQGHEVGKLAGLAFVPDSTASSLEGRAVRNAAIKALGPVIEQKLAGISAAEAGAFSLDAQTAQVMFEGAAIGVLEKRHDWLAPGVKLMGAEDADAGLRGRAQGRVQAWLEQHLSEGLASLFALKTALDGDQLSGLARGLVFQLLETGAAIDRRGGGRGMPSALADARISAEEREALKAAGVRCGRVAAWVPGLLKPAQARLIVMLRNVFDGSNVTAAPEAASFPLDGRTWSDRMLGAIGYLRMGKRAVRADMAERLSWQLGQARKAAGSSAFAAPIDLAATIGCPGEEFPEILRAMGLKPAERDKETGGVKLWRFAARARPEGERKGKKGGAAPAAPTPVLSGPFAALAAHSLASRPQPERERPQNAKTQKKKRRRKPRKPAETKTEQAIPSASTARDGGAAPDGGPAGSGSGHDAS